MLKKSLSFHLGSNMEVRIIFGAKKYPLAFKDLESDLFKFFMLAAARVKVASTASMPTGPIGEISIEGLGFAKSLLLCLSINFQLS